MEKYAKSKGKTWDDVDTQIEFLLGELSKNGGADGFATYQMSGTHYGYTYDSWAKASNTDTATKAFMAVFERPNMELAHTERRCNSAKKYYEKYHGKTLSGGNYDNLNGKNGINGHFTSNMNGKTFTLYNQNDSNIGLQGKCNRAVAASIASAYRKDKTEMQVISDVKSGGSNILSSSSSTKGFFDKYGLKVAFNDYSYSVKNMRTILSKGNYIAIWFNGSSYGKSGSQYCKGIHWIGVIGYKNEGGKEQIFVSDPAFGSSGWKDIDEFETCKSNIKAFNTVYEG